MYKFKVGDEVQVNTGGQKGKKGKIEKIFLSKNMAIIGGVNVYKRHKKVSKNQPAGIHEIARPIDVSKISLICPKCKNLTKVKFSTEGNIKKRTCRKCGGTL